jgi:hypothetical protein
MGIDLNGLIPTLVDVGYDLAFDIVETASYAHTSATAYDPSTGSAGATTQTDVVDVITSPVNEKIVDGDRVKAGDQQIVIRKTEFVNVTDWMKDDKLTIGSDVWQVISIRTDPTDSVLIIIARKINV